MGFVSKGKAEELLTACNHGTFLLRIVSEMNQNLVMLNNTVIILIKLLKYLVVCSLYQCFDVWNWLSSFSFFFLFFGHMVKMRIRLDPKPYFFIFFLLTSIKVRVLLIFGVPQRPYWVSRVSPKSKVLYDQFYAKKSLQYLNMEVAQLSLL